MTHYWPGEPFDIARSEVARWLCRQPEIMQDVFNRFKAAGLIEFDLESHRWVS